MRAIVIESEIAMVSADLSGRLIALLTIDEVHGAGIEESADGLHLGNLLFRFPALLRGLFLAEILLAHRAEQIPMTSIDDGFIVLRPPLNSSL
jgi:hypothetical protein